jgi:hypothetical protein
VASPALLQATAGQAAHADSCPYQVREQVLLSCYGFQRCVPIDKSGILMLMISISNRIHIQRTSRHRRASSPEAGKAPHKPFGLEPFDKLRVSSRIEKPRAERPTVLSLSKGSRLPMNGDLRHARRTQAIARAASEPRRSATHAGQVIEGWCIWNQYILRLL